MALINPVPSLDQVLEQVKGADVKRLMGTTYFSWITMSSNGNVKAGMGGGVSVTDRTGLLFTANGLDWGGWFRDYQEFHGRMIARTVKSGSPEVTAAVSTLEDLPDVPPEFFDAEAKGGDNPLLRTVVVDETSLRRNLLPPAPTVWPPIKDGLLEGAATTTIVVDRNGKLRQVGTVVASNPAIAETARTAFAAMQFRPYLENGVPVQVVSRMAIPFKSVRPEGAEIFESASAYFEKGRHASFPAAGNGPAYTLHAVFRAKLRNGSVEEGQYTDTRNSDKQWRREATIGQSRYARSRDGEKRFEVAEGEDAGLLRVILRIMEPIPAMDTFTESDWKIRRDTVDGVNTIRVLSGDESPEGKLDPQQARGYWFDERGVLVETYFAGLETQRSDFEDFDGARIARQLKVLSNGGVAILIKIDKVSNAGAAPDSTFDLPGHEWTRAFTDQVR